MMEQMQGGPPSQPKPGMSGAAGESAASPSAMGVQGSAPAGGRVPMEKIQEELTRGVNALGTALYAHEKTSAAIAKMLNEQDKIGSTAKAATMAVTQTAEKAGIAQRVVPSMAAMAVDEIIQIAEAKGMQFSEDESKKVLMSTMEMVLEAYGVDPEKAMQLAERASPAERAQMESIYKQTEGGEAPQEQANA